MQSGQSSKEVREWIDCRWNVIGDLVNQGRQSRAVFGYVWRNTFLSTRTVLLTLRLRYPTSCEGESYTLHLLHPLVRPRCGGLLIARPRIFGRCDGFTKGASVFRRSCRPVGCLCLVPKLVFAWHITLCSPGKCHVAIFFAAFMHCTPPDVGF